MTCKLAFKCSTWGLRSCPNCHSQLWPTVSSIQAAFDNKHARIKRRIIDSPPNTYANTRTHTKRNRSERCEWWFYSARTKRGRKCWTQQQFASYTSLYSPKSFECQDNKRHGWQCWKDSASKMSSGGIQCIQQSVNWLSTSSYRAINFSRGWNRSVCLRQLWKIMQTSESPNEQTGNSVKSYRRGQGFKADFSAKLPHSWWQKQTNIHLLQSGLKLVILWEDTHKHTQTSCSHVVLGNKLTDSEFGQL